MSGYILLGIAVVFEVFGSSMLKLTEGFKKLFPSVGMIIGYGLANVFLGKTLAHLPLSIAYAIWSGVGTAVTAVLGVLLFDDPLNIGMVFGIPLIIGGVVLLNTSSKTKVES